MRSIEPGISSRVRKAGTPLLDVIARSEVADLVARNDDVEKAV